MKLDGFTKSQDTRNYDATMVPYSPQALYPVLDPATTEGYFQLFPQLNVLAKELNDGISYYPILDDFTATEYLGTLVFYKSFTLTGCASAKSIHAHKSNEPQDKSQEPAYTSDTSQDDCLLCGNGETTLLSFYRGQKYVHDD